MDAEGGIGRWRIESPQRTVKMVSRPELHIRAHFFLAEHTIFSRANHDDRRQHSVPTTPAHAAGGSAHPRHRLVSRTGWLRSGAVMHGTGRSVAGAGQSMAPTPRRAGIAARPPAGIARHRGSTTVIGLVTRPFVIGLPLPHQQCPLCTAGGGVAGRRPAAATARCSAPGVVGSRAGSLVAIPGAARRRGERLAIPVGRVAAGLAAVAAGSGL